MVFREVLRAIKEHKALIIILIIVQVIFIVLIAFINVKYQLALTQNVNNIIEPLQAANYDDNVIRTGTPFLKDALKLMENYDELTANLKKLIGFQLLVFLTLGVTAWALTHRLFSDRSFIYVWGQLFLRALVFLAPVVAVNYIIVAGVLRSGSYTMLNAALVIALVAGYFTTVCLALPIKRLNKSVKQAFEIGITKIHYTLGTLVVIAAVFAGLAFLTALAAEKPIVILSFLITLAILWLVTARIFFVAAVKSLNKTF